MAKKIIIKKGKFKKKKTGYVGAERWTAHRLEGVIKNKAIKPVRKKKHAKIMEKPPDKNHNPDKVSHSLEVWME